MTHATRAILLANATTTLLTCMRPSSRSIHCRIRPLEELDQYLTLATKALDRRARSVHSDDVEDVLVDIDTADVGITRSVAHHGGSPSVVRNSAWGK
jgi:hypothetical protein